MTEESTGPVPWITPSGRSARLLGRAVGIALALAVLVTAYETPTTTTCSWAP
ncbi:hypothetical protein ACH3WN_04050 [Streptomyces albogriseolus]|uniref:hypothetical protein n=1 Tax=Streptomyces albogriseolus TaxID=1887 RepID=UPI0037BA280A